MTKEDDYKPVANGLTYHMIKIVEKIPDIQFLSRTKTGIEPEDFQSPPKKTETLGQNSCH